MREYEEGYPVDANDRYYQGEHPDPERKNSSNFGFANVKRNAVPGGNKVREDATDYLNERLKVMPYESTEVLFDQRVEFGDADGMRVFSSQFSEALESDKTHTVTYNGVSYDCVPYDVYSDGSSLFIGNKALFGQDDTGEPFAIMVSSLENGSKFQLDIISVNGDTSATVKIEKSVIHTIDPKFLPEMSSYCHVNIWYDENDGGYKSDKTYDDIKAAEAKKTPVIGTLTVPSGNVYTLVGCDPALPSAYLVAFNLYSMPNTLKVFYAWITSDNEVYVMASNFSGTVTDV